jgi:hypothetical protein
MLPETVTMLTEFYEPFLMKLADMLEDDKWLFKVNILKRNSSSFFFFTRPSSILSTHITGRDQTGYTVHAGFCMFPQS